MGGKPKPKIEYAQEGSGRPSKFTPERCASIVDAISKRAPYEYAAEGNGICESTLYAWLDIGKKHKSNGITSDYTVFLESIKRAELSKIIEHNDKIASNVDRWQADAWILERRWHKHYSPNAQLGELNSKLDKLMENERHEKGNHEKSSEEDDQKG